MKPLNDTTAILWDTTGSIKVNLSCKAYDLTSLPCGSLVVLEGYLNEQYVCVESIKVVHKPRREELACIDKVLRDPLEYALKYHIFARSPEITRTVKTYSFIVKYMRSFLDEAGFLELPTVIIGHTSDPGLRGALKVSVTLYGGSFELQSSLIMYKQLYASIFDRIYYVARNIRLEPEENALTGRHLVEFTQVDVECADSSNEDLMKLGEKVLYSAIRRLMNEHQELLDSKHIERLEREIVKPPYPRLTYEEAVKEAWALGIDVKYGQELSFEAESAIPRKYGTPVWVEGFPSESRGFYLIEDPEKPGYNVDYNLLLPGH